MQITMLRKKRPKEQFNEINLNYNSDYAYNLNTIKSSEIIDLKKRTDVNLRSHYYFVIEGIQCVFYEQDSKEKVIDITRNPYLSRILGLTSNEQSVTYVLKCLTKSRMLRIQKNEFEKQVDKNRSFERLVHKITEHKFKGLSQRFHDLVTYSMEERFRAFLRRNGDLINKVPHKYLASYLNMHPSNFSKLLGKVRI